MPNPLITANLQPKNPQQCCKMNPPQKASPTRNDLSKEYNFTKSTNLKGHNLTKINLASLYQAQKDKDTPGSKKKIKKKNQFQEPPQDFWELFTGILENPTYYLETWIYPNNTDKVLFRHIFDSAVSEHISLDTPWMKRQKCMDTGWVRSASVVFAHKPGGYC